MYNLEISEHLRNVMSKLSKKDKQLYGQLIKKIQEIIHSYDAEHYKNLRYNLKDCKRVHIGHFVLIFRLDKPANTIYFDEFDHHDNIYER